MYQINRTSKETTHFWLVKSIYNIDSGFAISFLSNCSFNILFYSAAFTLGA